MSRSLVIRWCALLTFWVAAGGSANAAIEIIGETRATFSWATPAGPVAGYHVYVARNGARATLESVVTDGNHLTIHGDFGDTIRVSTAAFDEQQHVGPRSELSDKVTFVEAPSPTPRPKPLPNDPPPPVDPPPYTGPAVVYDFNGDGYSDILLRNTATGEQEFWQMHGTEISAVIALPTVDPDWEIAGIGDFDSDGTADLLWFDANTGSVYIWFMGESTTDGELIFELEPGWVIKGVGDFDGDDRSEIAIGNESSRFEIWGMVGDFERLGEFSMHRGWDLAGIGDINGDGNDDFIFQDGRMKRIEAVLMSTDFSNQKTLLDKQRSALWNVIDSADYDGDGQSDLLWRDLSQGGPGGVGVWHLSDPLYLRGIPLVLHLAGNPLVVGSADYDGDGSADLLVIDPSTRRLSLLLMDRTGIHGFSSLGILATDWLPTGMAANDDAAVQ